MKRSAILTCSLAVASLLALVGARLVVGSPTRVAADTNKASTGLKVVAYYFHGASRCNTCRAIEAYSREAVQAGFAEALKTGQLDWRTVNVEEPANRHYIHDYQLYTRSVVLASFQGDKQLRWKNLDQVWLLVGDKAKFTRYVQNEVKAFLETH